MLYVTALLKQVQDFAAMNEGDLEAFGSSLPTIADFWQPI